MLVALLCFFIFEVALCSVLIDAAVLSCTTTGGYAPENTPCTFPFAVRDPITGAMVKHTECIPLENAPAPYRSRSTQMKRKPRFPRAPMPSLSWCATTSTYSASVSATRKKWGYCSCSLLSNAGEDDDECRAHKSSTPCAFAPTCDLVSFTQAEELCARGGARLCSVPELTELRMGSTSCGAVSNQRIWSLDSCTELAATSKPFYAAGIGRPASCLPTQASSQVAGVRCCVYPEITNRKRNVLMIVVDDLRPELLAAYGRQKSVTPGLDKFARDPRTLTFGKAYANYAQCAPSRLSLMTGVPPEELGLTTADAWLKQRTKEDNPTMPEFFANSGYYTMGGGKLFHEKYIADPGAIWSEVYEPYQNQYTFANGCQNPRARPVLSNAKNLLCVIPGAGPDVLLDFALERRATAALARRAWDPDTPFFMAVGFYKPHLPWVLHPQYLQDTPQETTMESTAGPQPQSSYFRFFHNVDASLSNGASPWSAPPATSQYVTTIRRAYLAAVMQTDSRIQVLLNRLDQFELANSTLVIVLGDHGFLLGENGLWNKDTLFELAFRVPLLMRIPWAPLDPSRRPNTVKRAQTNFIELNDLFRTTAGLMGLSQFVPSGVHGRDFSTPVLTQLAGSAAGPLLPVGATEAFGIVRRCGRPDSNTYVEDCFEKANGLAYVKWMGFSIRENRWRYSVWLDAPNGLPNWGSVLNEELYDHRDDSITLFAYDKGAVFQTEFVNLAGTMPNITRALLSRLKTRFQR